MPFFLSGIVSYFIFFKFEKYINMWCRIAIFILSVVLFIMITSPGSILFTYITGIQFINIKLYIFILIFSLCLIFFSSIKVNSNIIYLGRASFSLYLWHPLVIFFTKDISSSILSMSDMATNTKFLIIVLVIFFILIPISLLSYRFIEEPFMKFAKNKFSNKN